MEMQEFYIDYFDREYLDSQFKDRKRENVPYFQLAYGDVGGNRNPSDLGTHQTISRHNNFADLALGIINYLWSSQYTYIIVLSKNASAQMDKTEGRVLEGIVALHYSRVMRKEIIEDDLPF